MSKPSLRVYFIRHSNGLRTGILMRTWESWFDGAPPSAYGSTEEEVLIQIETQLQQLDAEGKDSLERYLWEEHFETREVQVDVHPQSAVKKRYVIGKKRIPLKLTYACSPLKTGGFRVMLPRFGGRFILEELSLAPEVLRNVVSAALLGETPRWLYDFRHEGTEYVREWEPRILARIDEDEATKDDTVGMPTLKQIAEELVAKAERRKLAPVLGDSDELTRLVPLLKRSPPPSLLIVGGPGVGKSTFVRRMARLFAQWKRDKKGDRSVHFPRIWSTSADRILAGMIYLGMWQERCGRIVNELSQEGDYLYVDRLVTLLRQQSDGASIAELLLPSVISEQISLIAECSEAELERCQRRYPSVVSAFQIVRLRETSPAEMITLLKQYQVRRAPQTDIHPAALKRLMQHLTAFQRDLLFPGKGVRFLDWMNQEMSTSDRHRILYPRDVSAAFSRFSGLPLALIADDVPAGAATHARALQSKVIGQDEACLVCARVLAQFKAGLNDPEKPVGTMLFVGPTGVGKTELAKQLTRYMFGDEKRMIRLDMSEFMMPGSAQRLLDVGQGVTSLAQQVRSQPLSLILLDEIEKADSEVFDLLLGVLGEGRLTDALGSLVDFRMAVIVMTSNLGVTEAQSMGFGEGAGPSFTRSVRQHFRPEFFNRIDRVVSFRPLLRQDVMSIVDLELEKAGERTGLKRRNLRLIVEPEAREWLAEHGHHPTLGARPLKRLIEERVIAPIAAALARTPGIRDRGIQVVREGTPLERALTGDDRDLAVVV